jgi:hypothetical protein
VSQFEIRVSTFTATAQPDQQSGNAHNVAVFAFTVHPDEKDVRVAISKQNFLLSALLWASTGLFLIQAGITITSLTSRGANCTPRRALDLAAVAVRVKSVGRQLAASIL